MLRRKNLHWLEIVFIIILAVLFSCVLFWRALAHSDGILYFSDVIHVWFFFKIFTVNALKHFGELPLWNPLIYSGVPFVGNPQSTLFYPPFWLFLVVPVHYCITLLFTLHIAFAGAGMYFYARKRRLSFGVSLFVSLVFILNYKVMAHVFAGHLTQTCSWSYIPWMFLCIEYFLECRQLRSTAVLAGCISMIFLAGQMQIFYYQMLIGSIYLMFKIFYFQRKEAVGILTGYIICLVLVVLMTAISMFPVIELMKSFHRSGGTDYLFSSSFSLRWKDLITFLLPYFSIIPEHGSNVQNNFFWERTVYCGIIPLLLLFLSYRKRQKYHCNFFIIMLIGTFLFSMGSNGLIFKILYKIFPGISYFRCPSRMFLFTGFALAVLSGYALQNIVDDKYLFSIRKLYRICFVAGLGFVILNESVFFFAHKTVPGSKYTIMYILGFSLILYLWAKNYLNKVVLILFIIGLTICDLGSKSFPLIKTVPLTDIVKTGNLYNGIINDNTVFRVCDVCGALPQYMGAEYGIQQVGGDEPVILSSYLDYFDQLNAPSNRFQDMDNDGKKMFFQVSNFIDGVDWNLVHLLNIKYIIATYKISRKHLILEHETFLNKSLTRFFDGIYPVISKLGGALKQKTYVYRNTQVLPRAFLLNIESDNETADQCLERLLSSKVKKYTPVDITDYQPNKIVLEAQAETPCYLVTSEVYYPGWNVKVNGTEGTILKVKNLFRGVYLDKGKHDIVFSYYPCSYKKGRNITLTVLSLWIALYIFKRLKRKSSI